MTDGGVTDLADLQDLLVGLEQQVAELTAPFTSDSPTDLAPEPPCLAAFDSDALADTAVRLERLTSRLTALTAIVARAWADRGSWQTQGHRAAAPALSTLTGASIASARRHIHRGGALRTMPISRDAVLRGRLSIDQLDALARSDNPVRHATFLDHEQFLVQQMQNLRWPDATRLLHYWVQRVDDAGAAREAQLSGLDVHCHASTTLDGHVVVDAVLDAIGGEIVADELRRLEREQWLLDQRSGERRTPGQRRSAALVEMAIRSASHEGTAGRAGATFTVLIGDDTAAHLCQLASGAVVHPTALLPHLDSAVIESVLFDGPTTVVGVSAQRTFTGALRRAILARDKFCTHPSGCDVPAVRCDVDHVIPWSQGGTTDQHNGRALCPTHNRDPRHHPDRWLGHAIDRSPPPNPEPGSTRPSRIAAHHASTADDTTTPPDRPGLDITGVRHRWCTRHRLDDATAGDDHDDSG